MSSIALASSPSLTTTARRGGAAVWTGRIATGLVAAFLLFDCTIKVLQLPPAIRGTVELGYPPGSVLVMGIILLACLAAYLVPRTAPIGAVLLTGYLGGAVASQLRVGNPLVSHTLFPLYVAVLMWGGLVLRDQRVRAMIGPPPPVR